MGLNPLVALTSSQSTWATLGGYPTVKAATRESVQVTFIVFVVGISPYCCTLKFTLELETVRTFAGVGVTLCPPEPLLPPLPPPQADKNRTINTAKMRYICDTPSLIRSNPSKSYVTHDFVVKTSITIKPKT